MKVHQPVQVVVVEDESLVAVQIQRELELLGMEVVGRASDGRQAIELVRSLRPDVVVMDLAMPEKDGFAAAAAIQAECPTPVVILTAHEGTEDVTRATEAGVGAFLVKPPRAAELDRAIAIAVARHADLMECRRLYRVLQQALQDKETLLKEVHHRVKNNLQLITSILRLQAGASREPETVAVLKEAQARITSVTLLQDTLYRSGTYARVALADYLRQIAEHLFRAQNARPGEVRLVLDLAPVEVGTKQAIPCGLIVNELVTNSLKHAFQNGATGEVRVSLRQEEDRRVRLQVSDTGPGVSAGFELGRCNSLGLQLVSDLSRQLQGSLEIGPCAAFTITFITS